MQENDRRLSGKVALVTGGGTGLGSAMASALAEAGCRVVICGRRQEVLTIAAKEIEETTGGSCESVACDVGIPRAVHDLFSQIERDHKRLDLLVNNAGINVPAHPIEDITFDDWNRIVTVNLTGAFLCTQQAFRLMKAQDPRGGRIINNGSISATTPRPFSVPYTATKHAITGLTKATALDGRAFDIACGQIDIGNAASDMTKDMNSGMLQANGQVVSEPTIPADQVAEAVVYMAGLPLEANILNITVMATKMPFVGRG